MGCATVGPEIPAQEMRLASAMETHDAEDQPQIGDGKPDTSCPQICDRGAVTGAAVLGVRVESRYEASRRHRGVISAMP